MTEPGDVPHVEVHAQPAVASSEPIPPPEPEDEDKDDGVD